MRIKYLAVFVFFISCLPLSAAPLTPDKVPEPLKPWIPWVLHGQEQYNCPSPFNSEDQWECSWPTRLELRLGETAGEFRQEWLMFDAGWISLPGDKKHWPRQVQLNGKEALVVDRKGVPVVQVEKGRYTLQGLFLWEALPEFLQISPHTALVSLSLNDRAVAIPDIDASGRVWLRKRSQNGEGEKGAEENRLGIQVYRRIIDEIPLGQIIHIEFDVSGRPREEVLGQGLPSGYIPVSLKSALPARIEPDGRLRLQVRPGRWTLDLTCRHGEPVNEITLASAEGPWSKEEIWVFDSRNHLRLVEVEGGTPIDPQQTGLPQDWRKLPAYRLAPGQALKLVEKRRGDPDPAPDKLTLHRNIWLDFSGGGYTIQDQITGSMSRGWRLEMLAPATLGQAAIDGVPQFITRLAGSENAGVEVRRGQINLVADSRMEKRTKTFGAVGWDHDFQQVGAVLHLPPGWRLFSAGGVDEVPGTWMKRWTLLDLFVVLIIALAIFRLWGPGWGAVSLVTLALVYHEPFAPRFVWLHILLAVALLRVLPDNRFRRLVSAYRNASMIALLLISLPFMVDQVRKGIFPQLERPWEMVGVQRAPAGPGVAGVAKTVLDERGMIQEEVSRESAIKSELYEATEKFRGRYVDKLRVMQYDPNASIQTGPGLPTWQWTAIPLRWNGPVDRTQTLRLSLIPPLVNMALALLRVLLLGALVVCVFGISYNKGTGMRSSVFRSAGRMALMILTLALSLFVPSPSQAEFPPEKLLNELQERLLQKPGCFPQCADSPRMRLELSEDRLAARIEVHALTATAVPLPGSAEQWLPESVFLNGSPAEALLKTAEGRIWIKLPKGLHQILMEGPMPKRSSLQLALPLKPHRVEAKVDGWTLEGLHENGLPDDNLQLTREKEEREEKEFPELEPATLPPFVRIERNLLLGLDWELKTQVVRISPAGTAVVLEVPLLPGESVTSEGVRVENGKALINMAPEANTAAWSSVFEKKEKILLTAPVTTSWIELWRVNVSPIWHAEFSGIPVVHHQRQNRWLPEWHPWPGESATIEIRRPEGVSGKTLTVDDTRVAVTPGRRATNTELALSLRSSQGGQHTIVLPGGSRLQSVRINGVEQPIRQEGGTVTLPLVPGSQKIGLHLQQPRHMGTVFRTPEIDLGVETVNSTIELNVPRNRWVLLAGGPALGPAILFWGVLLVVVLIAAALGRTTSVPLKTRDWLLLGIGLSAAFAFTAIVVVAWFFAMGQRKNFGEKVHHRLFNLVQTGLALLTIAALLALLFAIQQGLLGYPDMQISGNGSSSFVLRWYMDRAAQILPLGWVLTVPMAVYRFIMLGWALWLAFAMLRWSRWSWECFSTNGIWRSGKIIGAGEAHNPSHTIVPPEEQ
jgi:hypothetical protein